MKKPKKGKQKKAKLAKRKAAPPVVQSPTTQAGHVATAGIVGLPAGSKPTKVKPVSLAEQIPLGVYFDDARHTAIVHYVGRNNVQFVTMRDGTIGHEQLDGYTFSRVFTGRWPAYPLRRAARLYLASDLPKSETALRTLRVLAAA